MKTGNKGVTRCVVLIGRYAFKFPRLFGEYHLHFLQGCYSNWSERQYYKLHGNVDYEGNMAKWCAPSFFCSWFGLVQIQARCVVNEVWLTGNQRRFYKPLCGTDSKPHNFGYYKGKLVCLDYA